MKAIFFILSLLGTSTLMAQKTDSLLSYVYLWDSLKIVKEETRLRRAVMEGSTTFLSYFEVHTSTLEPGKAPHPPHKHDDQEELMIVKEGTVKITINGVSKILGPGSIAFAMPGDEHGIENVGNGPSTYYILKYKGKLPDIERGKKAGGSFILNWNDLATSSTGKGYRRDFFNRATSQLAQFEMHTTALNADSINHAAHTHAQEEIILLLKGRVEMYIGGKYYKAAAGDVIFLASGVSHGLLKNTGNEQCEYFAFQWRN